MTGYRYGPYAGGPDPLAPPYDARRALDEMGDSVLAGADPATALRDLLRRGLQGHRGLDDSQWAQWKTVSDFYKWCRGEGIYLNVEALVIGRLAPFTADPQVGRNVCQQVVVHELILET